MKITITVMAHPKRREQATALYLELVNYPFADVSVTWDEQNNEWHTGERAMRRGADRGDWHVVIQDDAILCADFFDNLAAALRVVPERVLVSLYTGTGRPLGKRVELAVENAADASWLRFNILCWGVGIAIPSDHIEPMLDFVKDRTEPYDFRIGVFYQQNRLEMYYTNPSLVDHNEAIGSLINNDKPDQRRVAHRVATGLVDWNSKFYDI